MAGAADGELSTLMGFAADGAAGAGDGIGGGDMAVARLDCSVGEWTVGSSSELTFTRLSHIVYAGGAHGERLSEN